MQHIQNTKESDERLKDELIRLRRDLHRIPELGRDLPKTTAYVKEYLSALPCEIIPAGDTGFCAFFKAKSQGAPEGGGKPGNAGFGEGASGIPDVETVAFRADMDALPIDEANDVDYRSMHAGQMHACGHDGHTSILLGLASELAREENGPQKNVLLIFQAAEETAGGAQGICESGVFERFGVNRAYGLHLWPGYPKNTVVCRKNEFMSSAMVVRMEVSGKSAHVASYEMGIDALEIGCDLIGRFYAMEKAELPPDVFRLLRFGVFQSGRVANIVSDYALIEGTLRTYSEDVHDFVKRRMSEIADERMRATGCRIAFSYLDHHPTVINDGVLYDQAKDVLERAGYGFIALENPLMVAEDFSCYQKYAPGLFFHLGTGVDTPLHSNNYRIDEDVLLTGVNIFKLLLDSPIIERYRKAMLRDDT